MGHADPYLFGPVGRMVELPHPVADGFGANYERTDAEHRSLTGATTVDVLGAHRVWDFQYSYRTRGQAARLVAMWTSPIASVPLRLIDPMTPNRLSLDAASAGGVTGTAQAASVSTGAVDRVVPDVLPDELAGLLDGAYRWEHGSAGELILDDVDRVPVLVGEDLEYRVWARGSGQLRPFTRYWMDDGDAIDGNSPVVELDPDDWQLLTNTGEIVPGELSCTPGVKASGGGWVELAAPLLTCDPTDDGTWTPGGGAPVCLVVDFEHGFQRMGRREMTMTIREA